MARHAAPVSIGTALHDEMSRRGWTQPETAEHLGVRQQTISRWLTGDNIPAAKHWQVIARFLHVPKEQVRALCTDARSRSGTRGVRRANDELEALRQEVARQGRQLAEIQRMMLQLVDAQSTGS